MKSILALNRPSFNFVRKSIPPSCSPTIVRCSASSSNPNDEQPEPSSSSAPQFKGFGQPNNKSSSNPAEALQQSLSAASNSQGRVARSTNVVLGSDTSEEKWRELDEAVNEYPGQRTFKAIGSGGDDFVAAMTACVESVIGKVHEECISSRYSAKGKWLSVTIGPVWIETPEQVLEIYNKMQADGRLKFYI